MSYNTRLPLFLPALFAFIYLGPATCLAEDSVGEGIANERYLVEVDQQAIVLTTRTSTGSVRATFPWPIQRVSRRVKSTRFGGTAKH